MDETEGRDRDGRKQAISQDFIFGGMSETAWGCKIPPPTKNDYLFLVIIDFVWGMFTVQPFLVGGGFIPSMGA